MKDLSPHYLVRASCPLELLAYTALHPHQAALGWTVCALPALDWDSARTDRLLLQSLPYRMLLQHALATTLLHLLDWRYYCVLPADARGQSSSIQTTLGVAHFGLMGVKA